MTDAPKTELAQRFAEEKVLVEAGIGVSSAAAGGERLALSTTRRSLPRPCEGAHG